MQVDARWFCARLADAPEIEGLARDNGDGTVTLQPDDREAVTVDRRRVKWLEPIR